MSEAAVRLRPGLIGTAEIIVAEQHTAAAMGSGRMPVLATPSMIALMEAAAQNAVDRYLPDGHMTIGTHLDVHHHGATTMGARVVATAELVSVDGRNLVFSVVAHDAKELIGEGVHRRTQSSVVGFNRLLQQKMKRSIVEITNT